MEFNEALNSLNRVIDKARVHFYKPIQIAEILYRDRVHNDIDLNNLATYRINSKRWRDEICEKFIGRVSTSSAKYQDDIFNESATPPLVLATLGEYNQNTNGEIEAYIYTKFKTKLGQMSTALAYCTERDKSNFELSEFLDLFWNEPGLRRSIDKVYEIIVYSLFSALVEALEVSVEISMNEDKKDILEEFKDFTSSILSLNASNNSLKFKGRINRVGVTNAADRGLDMWANFGLAIQIKHLSLNEELAQEIVSSITADRIVIVCKAAEERVILSLLNQLGWKSKIQAIVTEIHLIEWYEKALRGLYSGELGNIVLTNITNELINEFPSSVASELIDFMRNRNYQLVTL